jgi:hypothetical protein
VSAGSDISFSWQNNKMKNISEVTFHYIYELAKTQIASKEIKTTKKRFNTNTWEYYVNTHYRRKLLQILMIG